jgi:uncharacterized cupredoxin-like copper-binding protein
MNTFRRGLSIFAVALGALAGVAAAHTGDPVSKPAHDYAKARETAFGKAADPRKAAREVKVEMSDTFRFDPAEITVKRGEVVRFVARNTGRQMHEMVLGTRKELEDHAAMMKRFPGMQHDEPHMVHVAPGKAGEMGWQFTRKGEFYYGCLVAGHWEAGMVGRVKVVD